MKTCTVCLNTFANSAFRKKYLDVCHICSKKLRQQYAYSRNNDMTCEYPGCDQLHLHNNNKCPYHTVYHRLKNLNLIEHTGYFYKKLLDNPYCPYTGDLLILGKNAEIEHILPISRFPNLKNELSNLEWVSGTANRLKSCLTKEEFLTSFKSYKKTYN